VKEQCERLNVDVTSLRMRGEDPSAGAFIQVHLVFQAVDEPLDIIRAAGRRIISQLRAAASRSLRFLRSLTLLFGVCTTNAVNQPTLAETICVSLQAPDGLPDRIHIKIEYNEQQQGK
jgi:hypothetical protein